MYQNDYDITIQDSFDLQVDLDRLRVQLKNLHEMRKWHTQGDFPRDWEIRISNKLIDLIEAELFERSILE